MSDRTDHTRHQVAMPGEGEPYRGFGSFALVVRVDGADPATVDAQMDRVMDAFVKVIEAAGENVSLPSATGAMQVLAESLEAALVMEVGLQSPLLVAVNGRAFPITQLLDEANRVAGG